MPDLMPSIHLFASHSHLFRGARLTCTATELPHPVAAEVLLTFSDGVEVEADLLAGPRPGESALAVPAYRTAPGHPVVAAVWPVVKGGVDGDQLWMTIGQRLA